MKKEKIELTLCYRCAEVYRNMQDRVIRRKDYKQKVKEPCDICKGKGWDYVIEVRAG